ncbi:MAG: SPOR domain-containing protein [Woeseiaceae bacterium]|nr:SPOR domain-containing protein [Woeseiaceae bacterium]
MSSRIVTRSIAILALVASSAAYAAPGMIVSGRVESDGGTTELVLQFRCGVNYLSHSPASRGDVLQVQLEVTTVCAGASPGVADGRELFRPLGSDAIGLESVEYDGDSGSARLRLDFADEVNYRVRSGTASNYIVVEMDLQTRTPQRYARPAERTTQFTDHTATHATNYAINLSSSTTPPTAVHRPSVSLPDGVDVFVVETEIDGTTWYRMRLGPFESASAAAAVLRTVRDEYPRAWVDRETGDPPRQSVDVAMSAQASDMPAEGATDVAELMREARRAMIAGEIPRAVQIYTRVLQTPGNEFQQDAQEYLGLARERNGQVAHAKAEYERYLERYPTGPGADRVRQRLAALLAVTPQRTQPQVATASPGPGRAGGEWRTRTFASQHYRRDVNQVDDQQEIVSQSSLYSDLSIDSRRRGERFDVALRLTAGHRFDLMDKDEGDELRMTYAYVDVADARSNVRGRLGRQTRNHGGVPGRFDGLNVTYDLLDDLRLEAVAGQPVFSTADGADSDRRFYGLSGTSEVWLDNLDVSMFVFHQTIDGFTDRQSVGTEVRYFSENTSIWGVVDYDVAFGELSGVHLQSSWRLPKDFTVSAVIDRRRSPMLMLGNAVIGQPSLEISDMAAAFDEEQLRQIALDRSPVSETVTLGMSRPLSPKLQLNLNASLSSVDAAPASAGVSFVAESEYNSFSADLVASGLFRQGDVSILGLRVSETGMSDVYTANLDTRFSFGRAWRISPRLRVDYREIATDDSTQWMFTPVLRVQYRRSRGLRFDLEAGRQYSDRRMELTDQERTSWYVNVGYQWQF